MKLNYKKLGSGQPLFILHGLFGLSDNWATVGKALSEFFEVYLIDLRNHGSSPHSDEWSYPIMAEDINELIEEVKSQKSPARTPARQGQSGGETERSGGKVKSEQPKIMLIGHSLGGKVAMQLAAMHPEKLEKVIVVDMAPKDYFGNSFDFIKKLPAINLSVMKSRKEAEVELKKIINDNPTVQLLIKNIQWKPHPQPPARPAGGLSKREGSEAPVQTLEWKFNLNAIVEKESIIGQTFSLGEKPIEIPILFILGGRSNYIMDSDIPMIRKHFPHAEFKTIPGAGHWTHADKPMEFVELVKGSAL